MTKNTDKPHDWLPDPGTFIFASGHVFEVARYTPRRMMLTRIGHEGDCLLSESVRWMTGPVHALYSSSQSYIEVPANEDAMRDWFVVLPAKGAAEALDLLRAAQEADRGPRDLVKNLKADLDAAQKAERAAVRAALMGGAP